MDTASVYVAAAGSRPASAPQSRTSWSLLCAEVLMVLAQWVEQCSDVEHCAEHKCEGSCRSPEVMEPWTGHWRDSSTPQLWPWPSAPSSNFSWSWGLLLCSSLEECGFHSTHLFHVLTLALGQLQWSLMLPTMWR